MKNNFLFLLFCLIACFTSTSSASAQEQEEEKGLFAQQIQEFPFSEAVYLQEQHEVQATLSYYHDDNETQTGNSFSFETEYGLTEWLQVSAELEDSRLHDMHREYTLYRLEAGTMVRLISTPRQAASLALEAEMSLNEPGIVAGEDEESGISYTPLLIYARQLGNTQLHFSGGAELQAHEQEWFYNAAMVYGSGRLHPLLAISGTHQEEANFYLGSGIVFNSDSGWEFIAGIRRSLPHSDWDVSVKLLYEFTLGGE